MNPYKLIQKYYNPKSKAYHFLIEHSRTVAKKAIEVAKKVKSRREILNNNIKSGKSPFKILLRGKDQNPDLEFIKEAAMLHDIGIFLTNAPEIGCYGKKPYICHGYLGRKILEKEGFPKHALVCERHIGAGITKEEIERKNLPLPKRNMVPISIEEKIICFADKSFSKKEGKLSKEEPVENIKKELSKFGEDKVKKFGEWLEMFGD